MSSDDRREQILAVATDMLVASGLANISMEQLARACGVSKALIYAHFPALPSVLDGVIEREFRQLEADGLAVALSARPVLRAAADSAAIYLRHIAMRGSALHMLLITPSVAGQLSDSTRAKRNRLLRRMAKAMRRDARLSAHDAVAAAILLTAIPERAGRMVQEGQVDMETGAALCALLMTTTLQAVLSARAVSASRRPLRRHLRPSERRPG